MSNYRRRAGNARWVGYSLLEVVLASSICTAALVPALALLRDGMKNAERIDVRHLLLVYGVSKLEEQLAIVSAGWTTGTLAGDFSADGHADIRYNATRSDAPAAGGLTGRLMSVAVTVYADANGNDVFDAGEMSAVFSTKTSKCVSYEAEAGS